MTHSANNSLVITSTCVHCAQSIEVVLLTSPETGDEHTFWRHVKSGFYTCRLDAPLLTDGNMAEPDWSIPWTGQAVCLVDENGDGLVVIPGRKTTDCAGGCCYNAFKDECVAPDCQCHLWG